jgi:hypothetical protein
MRKIRKNVDVKTVVRYLYNRAEKQEVTETITIADGLEMPPLPANCILIEEQEVETKTVIYEMTPVVFFKNATPVEK